MVSNEKPNNPSGTVANSYSSSNVDENDRVTLKNAAMLCQGVLPKVLVAWVKNQQSLQGMSFCSRLDF